MQSSDTPEFLLVKILIVDKLVVFHHKRKRDQGKMRVLPLLLGKIHAAIPNNSIIHTASSSSISYHGSDIFLFVPRDVVFNTIYYRVAFIESQ